VVVTVVWVAVVVSVTTVTVVMDVAVLVVVWEVVEVVDTQAPQRTGQVFRTNSAIMG